MPTAAIRNQTELYNCPGRSKGVPKKKDTEVKREIGGVDLGRVKIRHCVKVTNFIL